MIDGVVDELSFYRIKEFLIRMKPTNFFGYKWLIAAIAFGLLPHWLTAELLEQDFVNIRYNTSSGNGVPLSDKVNSPSGSNGLAPSAGTVGQFGGAMIFGSAATPKFTDLSEGKSFFENATSLGLPQGSSGGKSYVLSRATVGAPMYGRKVNFLFGQIVNKPSSIGKGQDKVLIGTPSTHWVDEPFIPTLNVNGASELKGYATITTETEHGLLPGDIVLVNGVEGIRSNNLSVLQVPTKKSFMILSGIDATGQMIDSLNAAADDSVTAVAKKDLVLDSATMRKAHESLGYYYSPHAKSVVSIQPGPIGITWRERASSNEKPDGDEDVNWTEIRGSYFRLHTAKYTVSASPSKAPQSIYWNKQPMHDGPMVVLPDGLGEVKVVFSKIFRERVSPGDALPLSKSGTGQSAEVELRTLWVNQVSPTLRVLTAFNARGRVIMELLGDPRSDGTRQHLGFEIVDVMDFSVPSDIVLDLGDRVLPHSDGGAVNDESIIPDMRDKGDTGSGGFAIKKALPGTQQMAYYAIKETEYNNDLVAFWLRESVAGMAWPVYHNRYHLQWPVDSSRYSHYLRPQVGQAKAFETAVTLPAENSTTIFYQDRDWFGNDRADIEGTKFYSWLDAEYPTHRTLLGHETVKGGMAFEHVLSWLDVSTQESQWPVTEQLKHLKLWPKIQVTGNHGVPTEAQVGITARLYKNALKEPELSDGNINKKIFTLIQSGRLNDVPDVEQTMNEFEWPSSGDSNYATHFLGYFHPKKTGYYTFSIASDDQGELYLSTDSNPGNKQLVSSENTWSSKRKFTGANVSGTRHLVKGKAYFIESLHIQAAGGDNMAVAYVFSDKAGEYKSVPNDSKPISGKELSAWSPRSDLRGGVSVEPLKYEFEVGQVVEFSNQATFTFREAASIGDTVIFGALNGMVFDGHVATQPTVSVMPELKAAMAGAESKALVLERNSNQMMSVGVELGDTDYAVEFWFRTNHTTEDELGLVNVDGQWGIQLSNSANLRFRKKELSSDDKVVGGQSYNDGQWHHVAATFNSGDITLPGDTIWPSSQEGANVNRAIDNRSDTYYSNTNKGNTGFTVQTRVGRVDALALTSTQNSANYDPIKYQLYGSSNEGSTFLLISEGAVPAFGARNQRQVIEFSNARAYSRYIVNFPVTKSGGEMQIAEVELISNSLEKGMRLFVDGKLKVEEESLSHITPISQLQFGRAKEEGSFFDGELDELRIWNIPRSSADIIKYWEALLPSSELGLAVNLSFDTVEGVTVPDLTANNNDGALASKGTLTGGRDLPSYLKVASLQVPIRPESIVTFVTGSTTSTFNSVGFASRGDTEMLGYLSGAVSAGALGKIDDTTLSDGPRAIKQTVDVGRRLAVPSSEKGDADGESYWAGYIHSGTAYNPNAYVNPLEIEGFDVANRGAIIPVNADPSNDRNKLTVYWFREKLADPDPTLGYKPIYWPSVIGEYTMQWPDEGPEIVLASNAGSGALSSLQQKGTIYRQSNRDLAGYNPNEEHALMLGGQVWALRFDLNQKDGASYTSAPFVLLEYLDDDGRLSMTAFKVMSENPSKGIIFDYITEAGKILQAPQPLPLLDKPVHKSEVVDGEDIIHEVGDLMDREVPYSDRDKPDAWSSTPEVFAGYETFTTVDRNNSTWVYRGRHSGIPAFKVGSYDASKSGDAMWGGLPEAKAVIGQPFEYHIHSSILGGHLQMLAKNPDDFPLWLGIEGLALKGTPPSDQEGKTIELVLVVSTMYGESVDLALKLSIVKEGGAVVSQSALDVTVNNLRYIARPPNLSDEPAANNSFKMKFWYKNLAEFDWPSDSTIVPGQNIQYLKTPDNLAGKTFHSHGERDFVVYRPVWPKSAPILKRAETLTLPKYGLPAVRGQTSVKVLYEESAAKSANQSGSVKLHDPTREKVYEIPGSVEKFPPPDVMTSMYQGKIYFPKLPPHLTKRLFFDPNRGEKGALVFLGEFMDEIVGEKYIQLNLISDLDKEALLGVAGDSNKPAFSTDKSWKPAIEGLLTVLEPFKQKKREDRSKIPGMYEVDENNTHPVKYDELAEIHAENVPVDSYALSAAGPGSGFVTLMVGNGIGKVTPEGDPVSMHVIKVSPTLYQGELKVIYAENPLAEKVSIRHSGDFGGQFKNYEFEWRKAYPVDGQSPILTINGSINPQWIKIDSASGTGKPSFIHGAGGTGVDTLLDVYYILRYRPVGKDTWSEWTKAKFLEGWIKRVLAGINPFNQRVKDLYSNEANTDASMLTQAGKRWEGDVALSMESINDFGLIEIYETVLNRGKMLSIDSGINNAGANQALLLAAGYLNDLYMMLGNEAFADAANPTIGFGTGDGQYGDIATSMFAFKGQVASLMEEELGLLRGRDDFLQPDVEVAPVFNRMFWNYTRGIDSGEVIYALNYNIQERDGDQLDGNVDAADASHMYPQGHGDAYGHYLTAIKGFYRLLADNEFQWIPQTEAVSVLGQEVSVDYMDERKFAAAALALARTGTQVYELAWRQDYVPDSASGWGHMAKTRKNERRSYSGADGAEKNPTRYWGQDHWAARVGSGTYLNWVIGNAMIPEVDSDPSHEGIKKIDRTTVLELIELSDLGRELQLTADSAASGVNPLGLPEDTVPFDISPDFSSDGGHMDQIYERAVQALDNAVSAFDSSKDITQIMRTEEDSLSDLQVAVEQEELAFKHRLIEIYGTAYSDDIGPGKLYKQGYDGPDLLHYQYVERTGLAQQKSGKEELFSKYKVDIQESDVTGDFDSIDEDPFKYRFKLIKDSDDKDYIKDKHYQEYTVDNFGFFMKPDNFTGKRGSPGEIQTAISGIISARAQLGVALGDVDSLKGDLDVMISLFNANAKLQQELNVIGDELDLEKKILLGTTFAVETLQEVLEKAEEVTIDVAELGKEVVPDSLIFGFSNGGTFLKPVKAVPLGIKAAAKALLSSASFIAGKTLSAMELAFAIREIDLEGEGGDLQLKQGLKEALIGIGDQISAIGDQQSIINSRARALENKRMRYATLKAQGDRILLEREIFRKRAASKVHGYRTRDAAFRIFRNEKLERYKSMFDLAARYTYFAAKAYDYETGQLGSDTGHRFLSRIVASRALGVVQDGEPQFAGSNMGDPGLSSVLAEMKADWSVLRGRLGFNNPDAYGTTASLRTENHRILPGSAGSTAWADVLQKARKRDILADADIKKLCMQLANENGLPVPGIVLEFQTTIADGYNLFGKQLASGDHAFSPTSYANKIHGVGVVFEGYEGMDYTTPAAGSTVVPVMLNPKGLSATPYVYLIPCGLDAMRSPPLGDQSIIRTWNVQDATIPMPFNIGGSEFESKPMWQTSDSLSEDLFNVRKHQAFRAVDDIDFFRALAKRPRYENQFTNNRLIGRSVWNSKWKLVIPGKTLLDDPEEGLDLFINTVEDIRIHFETYSYSGN